MKLKNVLIVVKDNQKALQYYRDVFGLQLIADHGGNMILTEGYCSRPVRIRYFDASSLLVSSKCRILTRPV